MHPHRLLTHLRRLFLVALHSLPLLAIAAFIALDIYSLIQDTYTHLTHMHARLAYLNSAAPPSNNNNSNNTISTIPPTHTHPTIENYISCSRRCAETHIEICEAKVSELPHHANEETNDKGGQSEGDETGSRDSLYVAANKLSLCQMGCVSEYMYGKPCLGCPIRWEFRGVVLTYT